MTERVLIWSEQTDKIAPAFFSATKEMEALKKNASNPHFKSKYADLTAVSDTIEAPLFKHGLFPIQAPTCRQKDNGDWAVIIDTQIMHAASGQWVAAATEMPLAKADPQGAGSGFTYGRRYALQAMCGLAPEDDDGNTASQRPTKREPAKIDADRLKHFETILKNVAPEEVDAHVRKVQAHHGFEQTGKVEDLHDGDEARDAYALLKKASKAFTGEAA